jgi:ADP-ribose pyrophosphatase YjhB (NUDIX family)
MAIMVRRDGQVLMLRSAIGPFAGRWSMPFAGVADHETAEDALERMMREVLHVQPGPYEFLDTLYLEGSGGERFIVNAFTCVDWQGEPRYARGLHDDAVWAPPGNPGALDLVPEVREWLLASYEAETATWGADYDPGTLRRALTDARGELVAVYEEIPLRLRGEPLEEDRSPLDVITEAVDAEAYQVAETRRALAEPGHAFRPFNAAQWLDLKRLRPRDDEDAVRARMADVREGTLAWLEGATSDSMAQYINHPDRGVAQVGELIEWLVRRDRQAVATLRDMAQAAAMAQAAGSDHDLR